MNNTFNAKREKSLLRDVLNGQWGTIGPRSLESAALMAKRFGLGFGVCAFSATAALETVLRALNIGFGDEVIAASFSEPMNAMATAAVGATPVFADVSAGDLTLSPGSVCERITEKTKAIIADLPAGNPCDAKTLSEISSENGITFILNLCDGYNTSLNGILAAQYADVSIIDISEGTALETGGGGVIITGSEELFNSFFAYHNCGRPFGEGCSLAFDRIIGGNLRIAEWQACLVESRIAKIDHIMESRRKSAKKIIASLPNYLTPVKTASGGHSSYSAVIAVYDRSKNGGKSIDRVITELRSNGLDARRGYKAMHAQPVFTAEYFKKLTGHTGGYSDDGLHNSIFAGQNSIFIST